MSEGQGSGARSFASKASSMNCAGGGVIVWLCVVEAAHTWGTLGARRRSRRGASEHDQQPLLNFHVTTRTGTLEFDVCAHTHTRTRMCTRTRKASKGCKLVMQCACGWVHEHVCAPMRAYVCVRTPARIVRYVGDVLCTPGTEWGEQKRREKKRHDEMKSRK